LVNDAAVGSAAFRFGDGPGLRRGGDEHLAAGGADTTERVPIGRSRGAATGALGAIFRFVEIGLLDADVFPSNVEFIGDDHGEMGLHALTDLGILGHDGDDAVRSDAQECGGQKNGGRGLQRLGKYLGDRLEMESDEDASSCDGGDAEKAAAIE